MTNENGPKMSTGNHAAKSGSNCVSFHSQQTNVITKTMPVTTVQYIMLTISRPGSRVSKNGMPISSITTFISGCVQRKCIILLNNGLFCWGENSISSDNCRL